MFAIEATGLSRRFGSVAAVDGLTLRVPRGAVYGFLGPNGAGKTTTIRLLLGLIAADAGDVQLLGESLTRRRTALLSRVGALVETPSLYLHLTGRENLEVTRRLTGGSRPAIDRALEIVGLTRDAGRLVGGYSLGMRQRLGVGLALAGSPELLVLDEPTNGLDPAGILEMRELMRSLPAEHGVTVFLSSHLLAEVEQIATDIGIIHEGRLIFEGPLATLQARHAAVRVTIDLDDADGERAVAVLAAAGITVHNVGVAQPSLEELFLSLTRDSPRRTAS